jgi:hypothetical protein
MVKPLVTLRGEGEFVFVNAYCNPGELLETVSEYAKGNDAEALTHELNGRSAKVLAAPLTVTTTAWTSLPRLAWANVMQY